MPGVSPFFAALRAHIQAVWPDVGKDIYHANQIALIPFEQKAQAGELPLAVIDVDLDPTGEWGLDNDLDTSIAGVYWINRNTYEMDAMIAELEKLRTRLRNVDLTAGQVTDYPKISASLNLGPNNFFTSTQRPFWAGGVFVPVLVGETA